jgi:hypothetical protein
MKLRAASVRVTLMRRVLLALAGLLCFAASASAQVSPNNVVGWPSGGLYGAKRWIIVIHGGGWQGGANLMLPDLSVASVFNANDYGTYTIDYNSGEASYFDTVDAYDWLKAQMQAIYGSDMPPLCAWGESAGGIWRCCSTCTSRSAA